MLGEIISDHTHYYRTNVTHLLVLIARHNEDTSNKSLVVVEWVEGGGGDMEGPSGWVLVMQVIVEREKVNVMHDKVVTLVPTQQEANIEEGSTIKSGQPINIIQQLLEVL